MKSLMIAAIALSAGFAGMSQDAKADHNSSPRKRAATRQIVGGILNLALGAPSYNPSHRGHGQWGRGRWGHGSGPVIVQPARRFYVKYHIDGKRRMHFDSHSAAHRMADYLRNLGAEVSFIRAGRHYQLVYGMCGNAVRRFYSHSAAHSFMRRLDRLGFHASVGH